MRTLMRIVCVSVLILGLIAIPSQRATAQPVVFSIETSTGKDTLWYGGPSTISFWIETNGASVVVYTFSLIFHFSNGNIIGPLSLWDNFEIYSPTWPPDPELSYGEATDPDTLMWTRIDFGGDFVQSGKHAWFWFVPLDTGSFTIDSIFIPPANHLYALDPAAQALPIEWHGKTITVAPCPVVMGDVNNNGQINTVDVLYLIGYMFKGGSPPAPWWQVGDLDCSGSVTASDVIHLIGYIFLGQDIPCHCNVP